MEIDEQNLGGDVYVIAASGEIDLSTSPQLKDALERAVSEGRSRILVDLRGCTFIDSTGLGVILRASKHLLELEGGTVAVACTNPEISRLFSLTAIDQTIPVFESREAALGSIRDASG